MAAHIIDNHVVSTGTAVRLECRGQCVIRLVELNGAGCAEARQLLEHSLIASSRDHVTRTEPPRILHGQFASHASRAEHEHALDPRSSEHSFGI
jgi:hypothetical protein